MLSENILPHYATTSAMTSTGRHTDAVEQLPDEIAELAEIIQGLAIYQAAASQFYRVEIPPERDDVEPNLRRVEHMLDSILALDDAPLTTARDPRKRLVGVCDHFAKLLAGMCRTKGIPVRVRYGFASYFNAGFWEDHSVCEYWHREEQRWVIVDPQFDDVWIEQLQVEHDVLDVPHEVFTFAADAWRACRAGAADPSAFGIVSANMSGLWFIAGNLARDLASLNKVEMLQWDIWGAMPEPNTALDDDQLAFFDEIADLTRYPDTHFAEIQRAFNDPARQLAVPDRVFNVMRQCQESVL